MSRDGSGSGGAAPPLNYIPRPALARSGRARGQLGGSMLLGAHVPDADPLVAAASVGAQCLQLFLGDPQSWRKPPPRPDVLELRSSPLPMYVHAPYLINVASPNNKIRIPSRKMLAQTLAGARAIGAVGVVVHAGHAEDGVQRGLERWRRVFEDLEPGVPLLIENTAGGVNAMAKRVEVLAELWHSLDGFEVGFCFDTCHAHAAGEDLSDVVARVMQATGRIDLVHANSSRDAPGTGRDRHANLAGGRIDPQVLVAMVRDSGAPAVICETPWPGIGQDLAYLRERLPGDL